ncbi:MAG: hypothetical protein IPN17_05800 [Deltaproteobacteria bacterium]|nr:hypothetical protein [Deltaproteobacteria bacterium]
MAYVISGVIARRETLATAVGLVVVELRAGMALAPLARSFWEERGVASLPLIDAMERGADVGEEFWRVAEMFAQLSLRSPVAYVEAEIWAGEGTQASVVWREGVSHGRPLYAPDAISLALEEIGVQALGSDEFDALDLGRHRSVEAWLPARDR